MDTPRYGTYLEYLGEHLVALHIQQLVRVHDLGATVVDTLQETVESCGELFEVDLGVVNEHAHRRPGFVVGRNGGDLRGCVGRRRRRIFA